MCDKEDKYVLELDQFVNLLKSRYGITLNKEEIGILVDAFQAKSEEREIKISVQSLYQIKCQEKVNRISLSKENHA